MYVPPGQAPLREIKHPALPWDPATLSWFFPRQSSGHTGLWAAGTARLRGQGATVGGRERVPRGPGPRVGRSAQAAAACGQESPEAGEGTLPEVAATPGRPCHQELPGAAGCGQGITEAPLEPSGERAHTLSHFCTSPSSGGRWPVLLPWAPGPPETLRGCSGPTQRPRLTRVWGRALLCPQALHKQAPALSQVWGSCLGPGLSTRGDPQPRTPKGQRQAALSSHGRDHPRCPPGR